MIAEHDPHRTPTLKPYRALFAELKRRHVLKVASVYGAVAFVVVQAVDVLQKTLGLPEWFLTFFVALAFLLFPIGLVLAWAFEITPEGVRPTRPAGAGELEAIALAARRERWPAGMFALVGVFLLVGGVGGAWLARQEGHEGAQDARWRDDASSEWEPSEEPSIAVLPFVNLSDDPEGQYFGDGLAEEILNALSRMPGLRVVARTSAFAFRDVEMDVRDIGERLGVLSLLEGSVQREGGEVRITAQLVDARTGFSLWYGAYEESLADLFRVQEDIAASIVDALRLELPGAGPSALSAGTESMEAHDLYLLGLFHWNQRTGPAIERAIRAYGQAVQIDPGYARAWGGLALAWAVLPGYSHVSEDVALPRVEEAAEKALALDSTAAEPHAARGYIYPRIRGWERSLAELRRAVELDPSYAQGYDWLGVYLHWNGRDEEALDRLATAYALDPLSWTVAWTYAEVLRNLGRTGEALGLLAALAAREPGSARSLLALGNVYLTALRYDDARIAFRAWAETLGRDPGPYLALIDGIENPQNKPAALAVLGRWEQEGVPLDEREVDRLGERERTLVRWYARLDEREKAIAWLERYAEIVGARFSPWFVVRPEYRLLRDDPRFRELARVTGLPLEG